MWGRETDNRDVSIFFPLISAHPNVAFGFDFEFSVATAAGSEQGRYFCLYESGKKVFDTTCWLVEADFLNVWLQENEVDGDFYSMDIEEAHEAAAKALLHQRGAEEAEEAVEEVIASFPDDGDGTEWFRDNLCFENIALVKAGYGSEQNYNDWSRALSRDPQDIFDGDICQDAYELFQIAREDSAEGDSLLFAESDWRYDEMPNEIGEADSDEDDEDSEIQSEEDALRLVREDGNALKFVPEGLKTAELCLAAVSQEGRALEYVPEKLRPRIVEQAGLFPYSCVCASHIVFSGPAQALNSLIRDLTGVDR